MVRLQKTRINRHTSSSGRRMGTSPWWRLNPRFQKSIRTVSKSPFRLIRQRVKMSQERRSSVRVRSRLACSFKKISIEEEKELESRILDAAVLEAESVMSDKADWSERADELTKESVFLLTEIRALRQ